MLPSSSGQNSEHAVNEQEARSFETLVRITKTHDATSRMSIIIIVIAVRTSDFTSSSLLQTLHKPNNVRNENISSAGSFSTESADDVF
jgi:hypothetical protein